MRRPPFFFFNDTATTEIYTLSLHDALPILGPGEEPSPENAQNRRDIRDFPGQRSEEHTSELQSRLHLVCRLLLEKKKDDKHLMTCLPGAGQHLSGRNVHLICQTGELMEL